MSGELLVVRHALRWGVVLTVPLAAAVGAFRGLPGAFSVLIGLGLVLGNTALSAGISALAGRFFPFGAAMIALPSFAFRMAAIVGVMTVLDGRGSIDATAFAIAFGAGLMAVIVMEARAMKRTPWIALTYDTKEHA